MPAAYRSNDRSPFYVELPSAPPGLTGSALRAFEAGMQGMRDHLNAAARAAGAPLPYPRNSQPEMKASPPRPGPEIGPRYPSYPRPRRVYTSWMADGVTPVWLDYDTGKIVTPGPNDEWVVPVEEGPERFEPDRIDLERAPGPQPPTRFVNRFTRINLK